jgi:hypothetical protein
MEQSKEQGNAVEEGSNKLKGMEQELLRLTEEYREELRKSIEAPYMHGRAVHNDRALRALRALEEVRKELKEERGE